MTQYTKPITLYAIYEDLSTEEVHIVKTVFSPTEERTICLIGELTRLGEIEPVLKEEYASELLMSSTHISDPIILTEKQFASFEKKFKACKNTID